MDERNRNLNKLAVTAGKRQIFTDLYPFKVGVNFYPNLHFRENKARLQGNDLCVTIRAYTNRDVKII